MNVLTFSNTPAVVAIDSRGFPVCEIQYYRHPNTPDSTDSRITRHRYNARGNLFQTTDPRLHDLMQGDKGLKPNYTYQTALSGAVMQIDSVDAGISLAFSDAAGRAVLALSATGTVRTWQYEDSTLSGRPLSVTEQTSDGTSSITERFVYADNTAAVRDLNLAGQCVCHYDTAGREQLKSLSLTGSVLSHSRQLLPDSSEANWQGADQTAWDTLLTGPVYLTQSTYGAIGAVLTQTDAMGNMQRIAYDVAGQPKGSWLTLKGDTEQVIVESIQRSAAGQMLREEHGNGVVTTYTYEPQTQRTIGIKTERPVGHPSGAKVLQDLRYDYDPVGNVQSVSNDAEVTRFWKSQKVAPQNTYTYDSLYQLVSATGREMANADPRDPGALPAAVILPTDSSTFTNYSRTYIYDTAGNLTKMSHSSPATNNSHTTTLTVSNRSNRAVQSSQMLDSSQVDSLFTAGGEQTKLLSGQLLSWNLRGRLAKVTWILGDSELYMYDSSGQRVRKVQNNNTGVETLRVEYLPGLELRSVSHGAYGSENLHVIKVGLAGSANVRVLHWVAGQPTNSNDQIRYSYGDLIDSACLEVDDGGRIISQEEYYPYGGTAILTARSKLEVSYKVIRYSNKERDVTGFVYYGKRYYAPWLYKWMSCDPVVNLNRYNFVNNNPINNIDPDGCMPFRILDLAPEFKRHADAGDYNYPAADFNKKVEEKEGQYYNASTWNSEEFRIVAGAAQDYFYSPGKKNEIIELYGEGSEPFNNTILKGAASYVGSSGGGNSGFTTADEAHSSVRNLISALDKLGKIDDYDVTPWGSGIFKGKKAFRGLVTWGNTEDEPRYLPGKGGTVPSGSILQNRTFMSTSASPGVAAEFMLRQRDKPLREDKGEFEGINTFNPKRVIVEFTHTSGRNVVPFVSKPQAEILFNVDHSFKIDSVDKLDVGYFVRMTELDDEGLKKLRELGNAPTYDMQWGTSPLAEHELNTRQNYR